MKICFVVGSMSYSGAEKVLTALVNNMVLRGHNINVILLREKPGIKRHQGNINFYGARADGNKITRVFSRIRIIRNNVNLIDPELVVSFGFVSNINSVASLLFSKWPLVLCERNDPNYYPKSNWGKLERRALYPYADGYVFQTKEIQRYFSKSIQKKSIVIPNPVIEAVDKMNFEKIKNGRKRVITIARLDDYSKNHSMLIKSFSSIADEVSEYDLYIYGKGSDKKKYQFIIKELGMEERIFLCGYSSDPINTLKEADIFVLTSISEGMPNALIEAMSVGLPCISTDCSGGGARALIRNMENGIIVAKNDHKAFAEAIVLLSKDADLRNRLGKEAYKINKTLNICNITSKWLTYFQNIRG